MSARRGRAEKSGSDQGGWHAAPQDAVRALSGEHMALAPDRTLLRSSFGRGWPGFGAEHRRFPSYELPEWAASEYSLSVHIGTPVAMEHRTGGRWREVVMVPGSVCLFDAAEPRWSRSPGAYEVVAVWLDRAFVGRAAEGVAGADGVELAGGVDLRDARIERVALELKAELESDGLLGGSLYAESLATQLAVHLLREHSSLGGRAGRKASREPGGGLSPRQLWKVLDFIGDNLVSGLTLEEIAAQASLSPHHFSRVFRESTGLPPHRYVIARRVEKAKGLLLNTEHSIGKVAVLCGFSHPSHLNRHFGALVGTTPSRFRREALR